jgi:hypothetical protein
VFRTLGSRRREESRWFDIALAELATGPRFDRRPGPHHRTPSRGSGAALLHDITTARLRSAYRTGDISREGGGAACWIFGDLVAYRRRNQSDGACWSGAAARYLRCGRIGRSVRQRGANDSRQRRRSVRPSGNGNGAVPSRRSVLGRRSADACSVRSASVLSGTSVAPRRLVLVARSGHFGQTSPEVRRWAPLWWGVVIVLSLPRARSQPRRACFTSSGKRADRPVRLSSAPTVSGSGGKGAKGSNSGSQTVPSAGNTRSRR